MKLLEDFDTQFLATLNAFLSLKRKEYSLVHPDAVKLVDILSEFMNRKGKHIRPALFYFFYRNWSNSGFNNELWNITLAIEFVHALALIHDDIIDKSLLRRNKPTLHELYGIEVSLLVGDLALMIADELYIQAMINIDLDKTQKQLLHKAYNTLKQETLIGEYLDVKKNDDVFAVMKLKTAQYTFEKPSIMGMILSGASTQEMHEWSKILLDIGITFQIYDDFIGSFGHESAIGKSTDSDIKEGKNTLFAKLFLERAMAADKSRFVSFFGSPKTTVDDLEWFRTKSEEYGITTTICHDIEHRVERVKKHITSLGTLDNDLNMLIHAILAKISDFSFLPNSIDNQPTASL